MFLLRTSTRCSQHGRRNTVCLVISPPERQLIFDVIITGDVISLTVLGKPLIILNSPKAAQDMLNKKSSIYSSRPHYTMACDLVGWKDVLVLLPYGDRLRAYRRMIHQVIGTRASVDKFNGTIEGEAQICVRRMLKDPDNFVGPVRKYVIYLAPCRLRWRRKIDAV